MVDEWSFLRCEKIQKVSGGWYYSSYQLLKVDALTSYSQLIFYGHYKDRTEITDLVNCRTARISSFFPLLFQHFSVTTQYQYFQVFLSKLFIIYNRKTRPGTWHKVWFLGFFCAGPGTGFNDPFPHPSNSGH